MNEVLIQVGQAHLASGSRSLITNLDWRIAQGQVWAVLGVNGCGKSTLLRWLAQLQLPKGLTFQGHLKWQYKDPSALNRKQRASFLAWMPQSDDTAFECSVKERLLASLYSQGHALGWESQTDLAKVQRILDAYDLGHTLDRALSQLSGGERRRVAIAAAQLQDAVVTLLDEPLSQLDWAHQVQIGQMFRQWPDLSNRAVVWVTHEPNMALRYATHLLAIDQEGNVLQGPACDMAKPEVLARVYGCEIEASQDPFLFFPKT